MKDRDKFNYISGVGLEETENNPPRVSGFAIHPGTYRLVLEIPDDELENIEESLKTAKLMIDHSGSVRDIIGLVNDARIEYDPETKSMGVKYFAETDDQEIVSKLSKGYIDASSIGFEHDSICSTCGEDFHSCKHWFTDEEPAHVVCKNCNVFELSLVTRGEDGQATATVAGLSEQSIDKFIEQFDNKLDKTELDRGTPKVNSTGYSHARSLVSSGKIDHGTWSAPTATKDNSLAIYPSVGKDSSQYYGYPVISGGKVSAKGVGSALSYAEKNGHSAIAAKARALSEAIKSKSESKQSKEGGKVMEPENNSQPVNVSELVGEIKKAEADVLKKDDEIKTLKAQLTDLEQFKKDIQAQIDTDKTKTETEKTELTDELNEKTQALDELSAKVRVREATELAQREIAVDLIKEAEKEDEIERLSKDQKVIDITASIVEKLEAQKKETGTKKVPENSDFSKGADKKFDTTKTSLSDKEPDEFLQALIHQTFKYDNVFSEKDYMGFKKNR